MELARHHQLRLLYAKSAYDGDGEVGERFLRASPQRQGMEVVVLRLAAVDPCHVRHQDAHSVPWSDLLWCAVWVVGLGRVVHEVAETRPCPMPPTYSH